MRRVALGIVLLLSLAGCASGNLGVDMMLFLWLSWIQVEAGSAVLDQSGGGQ